ncbi:MAG: ATP-binding protein [Pseudomonadota bacterium]
MRKFVGRHNYLKKLENIWNQHKVGLISIYGRRRVGKTELIRVFSRNKAAWIFEAIEGENTASQIKHFLNQLSQFTKEPYLRDLDYKDWPPVFDLLSNKIKQKKDLIVAFDELSWMAARKTKLISYIKYYWDKEWKYHPHLLLILCGSVASWMVKNVVRSNALYGRISENILLDPLKPFEVAEFIGKKRGKKEILEYLLSFGGIPKYLEEMDFNQSIQINIDRTCFSASGFFVDEADKIFYNQFKETHIYKQIVRCLSESSLPLKDISQKIKIPSGGGLKRYLDNLISAGIVDSINDIRNFKLGKVPRYYMIDELMRFHLQFVSPNISEIKHTHSASRFDKFTKNKWHPFMGNAFERFCLKHRYLIAQILGFDSKVTACGSLLNNNRNGFQYDLVYLRSDGVVSLCEIKYLSDKPGTDLIKEMEAKLRVTDMPKDITVEKILISNQEASNALKTSGYFHHILHSDRMIFAANS